MFSPSPLLLVHLVGLAIGLGAATAKLVLLFRCPGHRQRRRTEVPQPGSQYLALELLATGLFYAVVIIWVVFQRPQGLGRHRASIRQSQRPVREPREDGRFLSSVSDPDRPARAQIDRDQCVRVRGKPERRPRTWKLGEERPSLEGRDASDPQLGIETVSEVVPDIPGWFRH